jgi:hypothetical protein
MGSPPTLRKARTGLFTPPGMYLCARANKDFDLWLTETTPEVEGLLEISMRYHQDRGITLFMFF